VPTLLLLGAIWGASFMFIEVADRELAPTTLMMGRLVIASLVLLPALMAAYGTRRAFAMMRKEGRTAFVAGIVNAALPFTLIAWGEKHVDSGTAAIANASMPIFVVLLALRFRRSERVAGLRLFGVVLGFAGVGVLAGANPSGGWWAVAGILAVVLASLSYAIGSLYSQHTMVRVPAPVLSTAQCIAGSLVLLPFSLAQLPDHVPGWKTLASVAALGIAGTAIGTLLYFRLVVFHGSARASLVVYLLPPFALAYGASFLGEPVSLAKVLGMALILGGIALGSGVVGWARKPAPVAQ